MSLYLSKCHIVGNHMPWLNYYTEPPSIYWNISDIFQHILLVVKLCITYAIPPVPHWIEKEMARWEFNRRQALKVSFLPKQYISNP